MPVTLLGIYKEALILLEKKPDSKYPRLLVQSLEEWQDGAYARADAHYDLRPEQTECLKVFLMEKAVIGINLEHEQALACKKMIKQYQRAVLATGKRQTS